MNDWTEYLDDPLAIRSVFKEGVPPLDRVQVHEVSLLASGPSVSLRFDLGAFSTAPPKKWVERGNNRVQVTLVAVGVSAVHLDGIETRVLGSIVLSKQGNAIRLRLNAEHTTLELIADFLYIRVMSAYTRCDPRDD
ncbi:hypothetical protein C7S18_22150 [Ahniella affigens]|uniref:Immunity protein 50 n=1 Tax=Ahniella affigens TaxID=2021234 RepID=A0A2P1PY09_9GAMM|nr:hypothetical protein C7S18_22150 [Ahniella affigens]